MMSIIFIVTFKRLTFAVDKLIHQIFLLPISLSSYFSNIILKYANTSPGVSFKNCETSGAMKQISFEIALNFSAAKYLSENSEKR